MVYNRYTYSYLSRLRGNSVLCIDKCIRPLRITTTNEWDHTYIGFQNSDFNKRVDKTHDGIHRFLSFRVAEPKVCC